jgi:nucleotide-binding universal stress UspA family protein
MQVLQGAPCAVAVAPDPAPPHPQLHRIGVGIDDTPESEVALAMARELAEGTGARLWLHCVVNEALPAWVDTWPIEDYPDPIPDLLDANIASARDLLATKLATCEGVPVDGDVIVGDPAGELTLASDWLDLLVLGSRRWGAARRLALGSTSERVIRHAACPVLVPPRHTESEPEAAKATAEAASPTLP